MPSRITTISSGKENRSIRATTTNLTGQLEDTRHQNQLLEQQVNALMARTAALIKRADDTEAHLNRIDAALAPPPPTQGTAR